MIFDNLENYARYLGLGDNLTKALKFLRENDPASLPVGRLDLDGDNLYVGYNKISIRTRFVNRQKQKVDARDQAFLKSCFEKGWTKRWETSSAKRSTPATRCD